MGGHVIPNAVPVKKEDFSTAISNLKKAMPKGILLYPIGSAGHKDVASDIDVLIDATDLNSAFSTTDVKTGRRALEEFFKENGLYAVRSGVSVHVGIPFGNEVIQADVMAVDNAKDAQPLHTHDYSDENMSGGKLQGMWADLANMSNLKGHTSLMMSPYKGLVDRESKQLITSNKDQIAKVIIGPTATAADMGNPSKLLSALRPYTTKYNAIKEKYFSSDLHEGTSSWFRDVANGL